MNCCSSNQNLKPQPASGNGTNIKPLWHCRFRAGHGHCGSPTKTPCKAAACRSELTSCESSLLLTWRRKLWSQSRHRRPEDGEERTSSAPQTASVQHIPLKLLRFKPVDVRFFCWNAQSGFLFRCFQTHFYKSVLCYIYSDFHPKYAVFEHLLFQLKLNYL